MILTLVMVDVVRKRDCDGVNGSQVSRVPTHTFKNLTSVELAPVLVTASITIMTMMEFFGGD